MGKNFYLIAKILSLIGKDGFVKVELYSGFSERFNRLRKVYIDFWGDKKFFTVESVKKFRNSFSMKFLNFDSQRDSQVLIGREVFVDDKDFLKLPGDHFFINDLIGSKVFKNDKLIGEITDVLKMPANDVMSIKGVKGNEILLPVVLEIIESFDRGKKIIAIKEDFNLSDD
ncbi:MAG: ribosome maturation factor RimM [Ignavibacteria bacterium]|nr:ribosome maturation factor RimM [Ignavibacteria bacterium]